MSLRLIVRTELLTPPLTGIGYYTCHLLWELLKEDSEQLELLCMSGRQIHDRAALQALLAQLKTAEGSGSGVRPRGQWKQQMISGLRHQLHSRPALYCKAQALRLSFQTRTLRTYKGWVQHATDYIAPGHPGPRIITIHDLSYLRHPDTHPEPRVAWLSHQLPKVIREAAHIITDSEFVREELLESGLIDNLARVTAIPLGFDAGFRPRSGTDLEPLLSQWNLQARRYILAVATLEPRKNFIRLLDAYCALPASVAREYPLVLTGASGWKNEALLARIAQVTPPHKVIITGYVSREAVQGLMAGAKAFVYPSLYEGFGLPLLEAMASGTPVLTSDSSSLAEVAGTAALCVDPTSTEAIADGIHRILEQPELAQNLVQAGLQRSAQFSWQQCAKEHLAVYRQVS